MSQTLYEKMLAAEAEEDDSRPEGAIDCARCGSLIEDPESYGAYWVEGEDGEVCGECYDEIVTTCQLCGRDDCMPSEVSRFILVKRELARSRRFPGIYRVTSNPFLSIPLIGSASLDEWHLAFIATLPKPDREFEISGEICNKCAVPYERIWKQVYHYGPEYKHLRRRPLPKIPTKKDSKRGRWRYTWWPTHWHTEREHTRASLLRDPRAVRDLECWPDYWSDWRDLRNLYRLPKDMATWSKWVVIEHKGVTVYSLYSDKPNHNYWYQGWLVMSPDPRYRGSIAPSFDGADRKLIFCASSLPNYKESGNSYYYGESDSRRAIIDAIDRGILTQEGVFVNGERLTCG